MRSTMKTGLKGGGTELGYGGILEGEEVEFLGKTRHWKVATNRYAPNLEARRTLPIDSNSSTALPCDSSTPIHLS